MKTHQTITEKAIDRIAIQHFTYEANDNALLAEAQVESGSMKWNTSFSLNFSTLNDILGKVAHEDRERMYEALGTMTASDRFLNMLEVDAILGHPLLVEFSRDEEMEYNLKVA
jgi:hypothetical protein